MKIFSKASLQLKLTVFVAGVVVVTAVTLSIAGYRSARSILQDQILERLSSTQADRCKVLEEYLHHEQDLAISIANRIRLQNLLTEHNRGSITKEQFRAESKRMLNDLLEYYPSFDALWMMNPAGIVVASTSENVAGKDISSQKEFKEGLLQPTIGVIVNLTKKRHQVVMATAIQDTNKKLSGVIMAFLKSDGIMQSVSETTGSSKSEEVLLGHPFGKNIYYIVPPRFLPSAEIVQATSIPPMQEAIQGHKGFSRTVDYRGVDVWAAYGPVANLNWGLVAKIDAAEANRPIVWLWQSIMALFLIMLIAGIWGSYELARRFTHPIMEMATLASAMAKGQRDARLKVRTADEIGRLGEALNQMAEKIAESQFKLEERIKQRTATLNAERYLLQSLMDHIPDHIYFKDEQSRFTRINKSLANWFDLDDPSEAIGKTDSDFFSEEHAQAALADERLVMTSEHPILGKEEKETWPNGSITWVLTSKLPFHDENHRIIGTFGISRDITEQKLSDQQLTTFAQQIARQNRQIQDDLAMAREVQQAFLPQSYPIFPHNASPDQSAITFCHHYETTTELGGDFFEIIPLSDTEVGIFIGDVMGHGVRAALVMAVIHGLAAEMQRFGADPSRFLREINQALATHQSSDRPVFASALYLKIDLTNGHILSASAGHSSPLCLQRKSGQVISLDANQPRHGPVLGLSPDAEFPSNEHTLELHDSIFLYTDGLYEAQNDDGEIYGQERLSETVQKLINFPLPKLQKAIIDDVRHYSASNELADDVCIVTFTLNRFLSQPEKT